MIFVSKRLDFPKIPNSLEILKRKFRLRMPAFRWSGAPALLGYLPPWRDLRNDIFFQNARFSENSQFSGNFETEISFENACISMERRSRAPRLFATLARP